MKKPLAILFSLLLVWAQVTFSAPTTGTAAQEASCPCCACGGTACCLSESSSSDSSPLPAPPARTGLENGLSYSATTSVAWTLPVLDVENATSSAIDLLQFAGVPLFTRHCALLI